MHLAGTEETRVSLASAFLISYTLSRRRVVRHVYAESALVGGDLIESHFDGSIVSLYMHLLSYIIPKSLAHPLSYLLTLIPVRQKAT